MARHNSHPGSEPAVSPSKDALEYPAWVKREIMKHKQAIVQKWLTENTMVVPSKADNAGNPLFLASEWITAAKEAADSGITPSIAIIYGLKDVLDDREELTEWYEKHGTAADKESTLSHRAFNQRLRVATQILKSTLPRPVAPATPPKPDTTNENAYTVLASLADDESTKTQPPIVFEEQPTPCQRVRRAAKLQAKDGPNMADIDAKLRYYLSCVITARRVLYRMWDHKRQDATSILLATRCFCQVTYLIKGSMEALRDQYKPLIEPILLELAATSMEDMTGICHGNLAIALHVLVSGEFREQASDESALTRDNVPRQLDESAYRLVVVRILSAISAASFSTDDENTNIVASVHAVSYIAQAINGKNDCLVAAFMITMIIDTTHMHLWSPQNNETASVITERHCDTLNQKIYASLRNPTWLTTSQELMDRSDRAAPTSKTGLSPLENMFVLMTLPRAADTLLGQLPCVATHRLLVMYEACADTFVVILNNCAAFAATLFGYQLLRQLEVLEPMPILDKLVKSFGNDIFLENSVSMFATKWHAVLGGKVVGNKRKQHLVDVTDYKNVPDRVRLSCCYMLTYPVGSGMQQDDLDDAVSSIQARAQGPLDKEKVRKHYESGAHVPINLVLSADISAIWNECSGLFPLALLNYFELYKLSLGTFALFHEQLDALDAIGSRPLPNRRTNPADASYSGISAFSALLSKVDKFLIRGERTLVINDTAIQALASCYRTQWKSMKDEELQLF